MCVCLCVCTYICIYNIKDIICPAAKIKCNEDRYGGLMKSIYVYMRSFTRAQHENENEGVRLKRMKEREMCGDTNEANRISERGRTILRSNIAS